MQQIGGNIHEAVVNGLQQGHDILSPTSGLTLSERVDNASVGVLGFVGIYKIPETVRTLCKHAIKTITAEHPITRLKSLCKSIVSSSYLVSIIANIGYLLNGIGVIATTALSWTSLFYKVALPISCIDTALSLNKTLKNREFYQKMTGKINPLHMNKIQILRACRFLCNNKEKIEKKLGIGQEVKLEEKTQKIIDTLQANKKGGAAEGKEFLTILRGRIDTKMSLDVANTALKVAGVATAALVLGTGVNPLSVTSSVLLAATTAAVKVHEWVSVGSDPFADAHKSWSEKTIDRVAGAARSALQSIQTFFTNTF